MCACGTNCSEYRVRCFLKSLAGYKKGREKEEYRPCIFSNKHCLVLQCTQGENAMRIVSMETSPDHLV